MYSSGCIHLYAYIAIVKEEEVMREQEKRHGRSKEENMKQKNDVTIF